MKTMLYYFEREKRSQDRIAKEPHMSWDYLYSLLDFCLWWSKKNSALGLVIPLADIDWGMLPQGDVTLLRKWILHKRTKVTLATSLKFYIQNMFKPTFVQMKNMAVFKFWEVYVTPVYIIQTTPSDYIIIYKNFA